MLYLISPLLTVLLLFALCEIEERAMESQQKFWLKNYQLLDKIQWGWSY